jgi:ligand-binding SRPBCC domain-containing protein
MSVSTCPIATIDAPVERVWNLLANPDRYADWWDAQTCSMTPAGPAQPGQQILAQTSALGIRWDVHITVQRITPEKRQLDLLTRLPLGITVHNHIACASLDEHHTRVSFG